MTDGVWAVVVAGGSGSRFGSLKQFATLGGRPVVERSVAACRSVAGHVVVVLPVGDVDRPSGADVVVPGGATRSASVRMGLAAVPETAEFVVVHDAARPLADPSLFASVLEAVRVGPGAAATCAVPVSDTLKEVGGEPPVVLRTLERGALVAVQTPQAFTAAVLRRAHDTGAEATDDAALVEALGATVRVVPGDARNLKLTTPGDLHIAEYLVATGSSVGS